METTLEALEPAELVPRFTFLGGLANTHFTDSTWAGRGEAAGAWRLG